MSDFVLLIQLTVPSYGLGKVFSDSSKGDFNMSLQDQTPSVSDPFGFLPSVRNSGLDPRFSLFGASTWVRLPLSSYWQNQAAGP
jgi:hypothetical protein